MRVATNPGAIKHLVERGMADAISAEFDRKQGIIDGLVEENARLKAEVERLTFDPLTYLDDKGEWMPRHTHLAAVERLQAEVERLTKDYDTIFKDRALLWDSHKIALQDIQRLHYALQTAKGVQS